MHIVQALLLNMGQKDPHPEIKQNKIESNITCTACNLKAKTTESNTDIMEQYQCYMTLKQFNS